MVPSGLLYPHYSAALVIPLNPEGVGIGEWLMCARSIAGVPSGQALPGYPITAHHSYALSTFGGASGVAAYKQANKHKKGLILFLENLEGMGRETEIWKNFARSRGKNFRDVVARRRVNLRFFLVFLVFYSQKKEGFPVTLYQCSWQSWKQCRKLFLRLSRKFRDVVARRRVYLRNFLVFLVF